MTPPPGTGPHAGRSRSHRRGAALLALVALCGVTLLVFLPLRRAEFLTYDDDIHVTENPHVQAGLTWSGLRWALTDTPRWIPLTWISHMLDCHLFGLNAGAHHLSSVGLHLVNASLLLGLLLRLTGQLWPSAFVAALFALHPLQVEPVAWISSRPHLVSTGCWLVTILAYVRYVERPTPGRYLLVCVGMVLGALSKRVIAALPFVLLLLDCWPLRRWPVGDSTGRRTVGPLLREKLPLLGLAAAAVAVEMLVLRSAGALRSFEDVPLWIRCVRGAHDYAAYLVSFFWPVGLACPYPPPRGLPSGWSLLGSCGGLLAASAVAIRLRRTHPAVTTGWFWYLAALAPVIGVAQTHGQAFADRYMYVPSIGLAVLLAWSGVDLARRRPGLRPALATAGAMTVAACAALSARQVGYWHDSITLFEHALAVTRDNPVAENNLGTALRAAGRRDEARDHFAAVLRIEPDNALGHTNMASLLLDAGDAAAAEGHARAALRTRPDSWAAYFDLGAARLLQGDAAEARAALTAALAGRPGFAPAYLALGQAFEMDGHTAEAAGAYRRAVEIDPRLRGGHYRLAVLLERAGQRVAAMAAYRDELRWHPDDAGAHNNLGAMLRAAGQPREAREHFAAAVRLDPSNVDAHSNLGVTLAEAGDLPGAEAQFREAIRQRPDHVSAHLNLGMIRAQQRDAAGAEEQFRAVLRLDPDNETARLGLAQALAGPDRPDDSAAPGGGGGTEAATP